MRRGASINYVDKQEGGRKSSKCQRYYISWFSKLVNEGGGGQKSSKFCQRSLWMSPSTGQKAFDTLMTSLNKHEIRWQRKALLICIVMFYKNEIIIRKKLSFLKEKLLMILKSDLYVLFFHHIDGKKSRFFLHRNWYFWFIFQNFIPCYYLI